MLHSRRYIWLLTFFWFMLLTYFLDEVIIDYDRVVYIPWLILRLVSFSLDYCNAKKAMSTTTDKRILRTKFSFVNFFGYIFYMPTYLFGPLPIYERYISSLERIKSHRIEKISRRFKELVMNLLYIVIWYLLFHFIMHYIYLNNVFDNPKVNFCLL